MATITNKTHQPLTVSLPGGKKLHLSPLKSGEISDHAIDHPPVQKLIEAGDVEIVEGTQRHGRSGGKGSLPSSGGGHGQGSGIRRTGDR